MTRRYYVPELLAAGGVVSLPAAEAHHALHVMRVKPGDHVTFFDGLGNESAGRVTSVGRNACICSCDAAQSINRELDCHLHLAIALPKPDRARELIERLTELGVAQVTPLVAERTQRGPGDALLAKLNRGVIEASKQCGRNRLMRIEAVMAARDFFAANHRGRRLIASPSAGQSIRQGADPADRYTVAIGPEGGFSNCELQSAIDAGFEAVDLGRRIYRTETAAVAVAALISIESEQCPKRL